MLCVAGFYSIYTLTGFSLFWMKDILVIPPFDLVNIFCLNSCVSKHAQSKSISTWVNSFFTKTNPYFLKKNKDRNIDESSNSSLHLFSAHRNANFIGAVTVNTSPQCSNVAASIFNTVLLVCVLLQGPRGKVFF